MDVFGEMMDPIREAMERRTAPFIPDCEGKLLPLANTNSAERCATTSMAKTAVVSAMAAADIAPSNLRMSDFGKSARVNACPLRAHFGQAPNVRNGSKTDIRVFLNERPLSSAVQCPAGGRDGRIIVIRRAHLNVAHDRSTILSDIIENCGFTAFSKLSGIGADSLHPLQKRHAGGMANFGAREVKLSGDLLSGGLAQGWSERAKRGATPSSSEDC